MCLLLFKSCEQGKEEGTWLPSQGLSGAVCSDLHRPCCLHGYIISGCTHRLCSRSLQITCARCKEIPWAVQGSRYGADGNWGYSATNITKTFLAISGFYSQLALKNTKQTELSSNNRQQLYFDCFLAYFFCFVLFCCSLEYNFSKRERKKGKGTRTMCASLQMLLM